MKIHDSQELRGFTLLDIYVSNRFISLYARSQIKFHWVKLRVMPMCNELYISIISGTAFGFFRVGGTPAGLNMLFLSQLNLLARF